MDVSKSNFDSLLPKILADIKSSSFIAIDTEFTALHTNDSFKTSYFDSGTSTYNKERSNLENVSICQIGISIFKGLIDNNSYSVNTYNIYTRPHSLLSVDENILFQVSSIEFLERYKFDFKKWLLDGIPCLNKDQQNMVKEFYNKILSGEAGIWVPYEILDQLEVVKAWCNKSEIGDTLDIVLNNDTEILLFFSSILNSGLRVLPIYENDKLSVVLTESVKEVQILLNAKKTLKLILDRLDGFGKVFTAIVEAKVPLTMHNGLKDILLMYKQFHRNLPKNYHEFKNDFHEMFPLVYDTKQLAFILGLKLKDRQGIVPSEERFLRKTSLKSVKTELEKEVVVMHRPRLQHSLDTPKYSDGHEFLHEAGYDAFCTGYCFLHLSHIYAMIQYEKVDYHRPLSPRELIHSMKQWSNEIPVQKSGIKYMALDGSNPTVSKLSWLVVESRNPFRSLTPEAVEPCLAPFGAFDIIKRNKRSVMIASPRKTTTEDIIRTLGTNKHFRVSRYKAIKHSPVVRSVAWSCALLSAGVSTFFLMTMLK